MHAGERPFVGRDAELELAQSGLTAAAAGNGGVLVLTGPAGMGKTRLVEKALVSAGAVGRGYCVSGREAPPLWPWRQALRSLARLDARPAVTAAASAVQQLAGPTDSEREGDTGPARLAVLATAADAVLDAAGQAPLVVVLEDLQWADSNTLDLLMLVAGGAPGTRLALLATVRSGPPSALDPADLARLPGVSLCDLAPLTAVDVAAYLRDIPGAVSAERVLARSGGLPLLLDAAIGEADGAPANPDLIAGALDAVPADVRRCVEVAALLRQPVQADLVSAVSGQSMTVAALEAGCRAGVLVRAAAMDGVPGPAYRTRHDLLTDALLARMDPAVRREVHRSAATVLTGRPGADAADIAAHWLLAGDDSVTQRSAAYWSARAAKDALQSLGYDLAVQHGVAAVEALRRARSGDAELAAAVVDLARAEYLSGHLIAALERCEEAAAYAAAAGRPDLLAAAALVVRWVTFPRAGQVVGRLCRAALTVEQPPLVRSRLLAQLATILAQSGSPAEAGAHAAEATRLALADGDPQAVVDAGRAREMTLVDADDVHEWLRLADLVIPNAESLRHSLSAVVAHGWRLRAAYQLGQLDVVAESSAAVAELATRSGQPLAHWHHKRYQASQALLEGRFDAARALNGAAGRVAADSGDPTATGISQVFGCWLALMRGDPAEIPAGFWAFAEAANHLPLVWALRAGALLLAGRDEEARLDYERVRPALHDPVIDMQFHGMLVYLVEPMTAFGDARDAHVLAGHLAPYARYPGTIGAPTVAYAGSARRLHGIALAQAGEAEAARNALAGAVAADTAMGARPFVVLDRLALAELLLAQSEPMAAQPVAAAAAQEARRLDLPGPLARADRLLTAAGAAVRAQDPLTAREREVARLVREAMSNRAIAERLVLSERTVESHVRSILGKLGYGNRTELVARWPG